MRERERRTDRQTEKTDREEQEERGGKKFSVCQGPTRYLHSSYGSDEMRTSQKENTGHLTCLCLPIKKKKKKNSKKKKNEIRWSTWSVKERIQLSIARAVLKLGRHDHSNISVLEAIGWPSLAWRRRRFKLLLLWDLLHGGGPPLLHEQVPPLSLLVLPILFVNSLSISLPTCHSSRYSKSFLVSAISLYNSLPQSVSSCSSKHSFAQALNHHFASDKFSFGIS